eukprot:121229-Pleurochrysis_carterae.AAC.2
MRTLVHSHSPDVHPPIARSDYAPRCGHLCASAAPATHSRQLHLPPPSPSRRLHIGRQLRNLAAGRTRNLSRKDSLGH